MPIRLTDAQVDNAQLMEVVVSGPDTANRLYVAAGTALTPLNVWMSTTDETFTLLVGPVLTRPQFHRAIATASLSRVSLAAYDPTAMTQIDWGIESVDADWDDESGQVELSIEASVSAPTPSEFAGVAKVAYQVTILAEL